MKTLYFHIGHRDVVGGGQLALYHLAVALQDQFDVYLSTDWNEAMWGYEFMQPPKRDWKIGAPHHIDVFLCSEYVKNHEICGDFNVQYTFFPRYRWDVSAFDWVITLSEYSQRYVKEHWNFDGAKILCGGVFSDDYNLPEGERKAPVILNSSRFFMEGDPERLIGHSKNQHVLIQSFKSAVDRTGNHFDWELKLAGSVLTEEDGRYLDQCRKVADGYPVFFYPMLGKDELLTLYREAAVFAHAMGYNRDDVAETEHYGFCVEKAIMTGAHPIVHASGGAPEFGGDTFRTRDQLVDLFAERMEHPVSVDRPFPIRTRTFASFVQQVGSMFEAVA